MTITGLLTAWGSIPSSGLVGAVLAQTGQVIIDNAGAGVQDAAGGRTFTGTWCTSAATNFFGTDSLFSCSSAGTDTYRWTPTLTAGTYDVYVWWSTNPNRGTVVPVSVVNANGTATVNFNERVGGGQWVLHGRYAFNAGTGGYVQVAGTPTQQANADAVKFVPSSGNPVPVASSLSPTSAAAGGPALTLTVTGSSFVSSSVVRWNGSNRTTTFVSATQLQAAIGAADIAAAGTASVTVFTPTPGGGQSGALSFTITPPVQPGQLIIDNAAAGVQDAAGGRTFTGTWCKSGATNFFGTDSLFSCSNSGTDTYRWTPTLTAGTYDVYVWWSTNPNRGTVVPVSVVNANGTTTVNVNEQVGGGQWVLHGRYAFNAGTGGYVQVAGTPTQQANADAVKFVPSSGNPIPVASSLSPTSAAAGGPALTLTVTGSGFVSSSVVRWNGNNRTTTFVSATQVQAAIGAADIAAAGTASVTVFTPTPGGGQSGTLSFTITPAVQPGQLIIDNAAAGVQDAAGGRTFTGTWCTSGATNFFGTDSLYSCSDTGTDTYRWTPTLTAGTYDVYIWWSTTANRSTAVPVSVVHANGTATVNFNEKVGGGQWVLHGRYAFNAGTGGYVQVAGTPTQQANADAVKFVSATGGVQRFSGPYESPFICMTQQAGLGAPLDANCTAPTITTYWYYSTAGTFKSLADPTQRPADLSQAVVDGQSVPFIVRVEKGTINRSIYEIARLNDSAGWNGRLIYIFGGGCEGGWYIQGSATAGVLDPVMLGRGYATASASLNVFGVNCNDVLAAETMAMVKDRFLTAFGAPAFTIGWGCSGGSYQAHQISDNYPGLLNGIIVGCSFPDVTSSTILTVTDASLLQHYFGGSTVAWTTEQKRAVIGFAQADAIATLTPHASRIDPDAVCDSSIPPELRYNAATNPTGARCDVYDHTVNVYGRNPQTGFARRPLDNVGVQYGLGALNAGVITKQQFLDLNANIGGFDNDANFIAARTVGDTQALQAAHETGRVLFGGAGLAGTPIIDYRAYVDLVTGGDLHMKIHSFSTRERLRLRTGQTANHLILVEGDSHGDFSTTSPVLAGALAEMDDWLVALLADNSTDPPAVKAARAKPSTLVDACYDSAGQKIAEPATVQGGTCNSLYPTFSTPRLVAGAPLADDVLKCGLKALTPSDYAVTFTTAEWTQLQQIFPGGVCDYAHPGSWQVPLRGTWLSY